MNAAQNAFRPDYCFRTREQAEGVAFRFAKNHGMDPNVQVILESKGKFAVVPRQFASEYGVKTDGSFSDRDRVYSLTKAKQQGTVVKAGPQVCEVKWDDGIVQNEPNYYLGKVRVKRERVKPIRK